MTVTAPELLRGGPPPCLLHLHRFPACLYSGPPGTRHRRTPNEGREVQGPLDVTVPLSHPHRGLPFTCVSPWGFVTVSRPRAPMPPTHAGRGTRETGRGPAEAGEARGGRSLRPRGWGARRRGRATVHGLGGCAWLPGANAPPIGDVWLRETWNSFLSKHRRHIDGLASTGADDKGMKRDIGPQPRRLRYVGFSPAS